MTSLFTCWPRHGHVTWLILSIICVIRRSDTIDDTSVMRSDFKSELHSDGTIKFRVILSNGQGSHVRCAAACLKEEYCRYFSYTRDTGQCELSDASVVSSKENRLKYFSRSVCITAYRTSGFLNYIFPLPAFDGEIVLDFALQTSADAIVSLSTDGTFGGVKYELVIGHGGGVNTVMRRCWSCTNLKVVPSEDVVNESQMRRFWLQFDNNRVALGKYHEEAYIEWTDTGNIPTPTASPVWFLGLGGWASPVDWLIYQNC
ncbi:uncharacterized protein LOC110975480 [Acanthaster planci]|uniref:Uncharacterized protein LOC110975480 n=1 Tax=Acanthaster planci TaxID=133434 RepID=A0A8B7XTZ7_ACAPL|nr:uncharacterized protein LOC110975480 [Acanthaster planci]